MSDSYYNTNNEQGVLLFKSNKKAKSQEEDILKIFKSNPDTEFSPEDIWFRLGFSKVLLTSVRRALSNLSNAKKWYCAIYKTDNMKAGNYGKNVHTWKLSRNERQEHSD